MRIPNMFKLFSLLLMLAFSAGAAAAQYQLGSGDVIRINVHGEPDLTFEELRLTDAGTFTFPFIGEVDRKSTRLNSSHMSESRMPSSA